jgi:hypothetical protein
VVPPITGLKPHRLHLVFELKIAARCAAALRRVQTVLDKHNGQEYLHQRAAGHASIACWSFPRTPMDFTVLMRLPDNQGKAQYRIRNEEHGHERVEQGSNLELMASVSSH